jgi:uncharacterized protein DUF397
VVPVTHDLSGAVWRKSTRSGSEGNCVEVATNLPGVVAIRDSKNRAGVTLTLTPAEWTEFISGIRSGIFDV